VAPGATNEAELLTGQYEVAAQLDLTVNDTGGLAPSVSFINGPFTFDIGAKLEQSREQNFSQKLYYSLLDLREEVDADTSITNCARNIDTNLAGDLGIRQVVDMALNSNYLNVKAKASENGAFGGYVTFVVTKNLNGVGPTWMLTHFKGPGGLGSLSEVNTDKLTFAFAESEHPLTAEQLDKRRKRAGSPKRSAAKIRTSAPFNFRAEQLLNQLLIEQISNHLSTMRALR